MMPERPYCRDTFNQGAGTQQLALPLVLVSLHNTCSLCSFILPAFHSWEINMTRAVESLQSPLAIWERAQNPCVELFLPPLILESWQEMTSRAANDKWVLLALGAAKCVGEASLRREVTGPAISTQVLSTMVSLLGRL